MQRQSRDICKVIGQVLTSIVNSKKCIHSYVVVCGYILDIIYTCTCAHTYMYIHRGVIGGVRLEENTYQPINPLTTISVPFGYKLKRLHSLPQTSNCGDLIILDSAKVKWQVVSAVAS